MLQKDVIESETRGDDNEALNSIMSEDEIQKAIEKLNKLNKATGIDKIPNEILKRAGVREILHELLSLCFQRGMAHRLWLRDVVL